MVPVGNKTKTPFVGQPYHKNNAVDWFKINSLKANPCKFQFMVLVANKNDCFNLNVAGKTIPSSNNVTLTYN